MDLETALQIIADEREQFQREEEQGILQRSMDKAIAALAGKDACARIERSFKLRWQMNVNIAAVRASRLKAVRGGKGGKQ